MKKLVKVRPSNIGSLCIDIELGDVCNYKCSYCYPYLHPGTDWLDYKSLISFLDKRIKENDTVVMISGGEPTLYPHISSILKYLQDRGCHTKLLSNSSKPLKWWEKHIKYIDELVLSYQIETQNLDEFLTKVKCLTENNIIQINVSMINDRFDECIEIAEKLKEIKNLMITLKVLKDKKTHRMYDYTEEQIRVMSKKIFTPRTIEIKNPLKIFSHVYSDGSEEIKFTQEVVAKGLNSYKGWKCWKGIDLIKIRSDGNYYLATCDFRGNKYYGNISDKNLNFPTEPTICEYDYCFCMTDINNIRKEK